MSDMKKVKRGDPLSITAKMFNSMIDAARAHKNRTHNIGKGNASGVQFPGTVMVRNDSGETVGQFGILGIDAPLVAPDANENTFRSRVALSCVTPTLNVHGGNFAILAEPLVDGKIGQAFIHGACPVQINVIDEGHGYATVIDSDASMLASAPSGTTQILWKEAGTGTKWAVVRLGCQPAQSCRYAYTWDTKNSDGSHWTSPKVDQKFPAYAACISMTSSNAIPPSPSAEDVDTYIRLNDETDKAIGLVVRNNPVIAYVPGDRQTTIGSVTIDGYAIPECGCQYDVCWRA